MTYSEPARATTRAIPGLRVVGLLVVLAATAAALGYGPPGSPAPSAPSGAPVVDTPRDEPPVALPPRVERRGAPAEPDGSVPYGTTVFDDEIAGVANLDASLLAALRRAATDAAADGVEILVNSGWRSAEYQERLLREAVSRYGSEREAARWVATPESSAHVSGDAVDVGLADAATWLSEHGAGYGLCRVYANEPWHYELRPDAIDDGCPPPYADPTHDPRTWR